jgi:hypothetical protein
VIAADARRSLEAAFRWADEVTPPGCWRALPAETRADLQRRLDTVYAVIDDALLRGDARDFDEGIGAFRDLVLAAVEHEEVA